LKNNEAGDTLGVAVSRPLANQLTLQRPPLLIGQVGDSDLQHYSPLTACQKPPTSEALYILFFN
jgi:hypothetical protein